MAFNTIENLDSLTFSRGIVTIFHYYYIIHLLFAFADDARGTDKDRSYVCVICVKHDFTNTCKEIPICHIPFA